jgi:GT2 family glycosyltransferase
MAPRTRRDKPFDGDLPFEEQRWVSGAAMLFPRIMIDQIGAFDENIFLFSEEVDLCERARKAGYDIVISNNIYMDHAVGGSTGFNPRINYMKNWHMGWSRLYYDAKHGRKPAFIRRTLLSLLKYGAKFLLNLISGNKNKFVKYKGLLAGSISYLMGRAAFNENGEPRGF